MFPVCTQTLTYLEVSIIKFELKVLFIFSADNVAYASTLRKLDLSIVPNDECQNILRQTELEDYFNLDSSFMCAGGQPDSDTCEVRNTFPVFKAIGLGLPSIRPFDTHTICRPIPYTYLHSMVEAPANTCLPSS